ncbi:MAG: nicotinate (nicotinamide) nucleotide adenylyltransferase [Acidimicrobiales bacterium]
MPSSSRPERVGLLGGTFDPPHRGHVEAASSCVRALELDRLLLVVANEPWQKVPLRHVTPVEDRLAMVEAMRVLVPGAEVSRIEIERGGPSYTADTVDELLADAARRGTTLDLYLIVGSDLLAGLGTWKRVEELRASVTLAVVARPHSSAPVAAGWRTVFVAAEAVDVSSSEVRDRLERGLPVEGLVPSEVIRSIRSRGLYAVRG